MTRLPTSGSRITGSYHAKTSMGAIPIDGHETSESEALREDEGERLGADELEDAFREIDTLSEDVRTKQSAYGGGPTSHRRDGGHGRIMENDLEKKLSMRTSEAIMAMSSLPGAFDSNGRPLPKPSQQRLINMARDQKEERNHRHNLERDGPNIEPAKEQLPLDDLQVRMNSFITLANKEAFEAQEESRRKQKQKWRRLVVLGVVMLLTIIAVVVGIILGTGGSSSPAGSSKQCLVAGNGAQELDRYVEIRSAIVSMNPDLEVPLNVANSTARKSLCWLAYDDALDMTETTAEKQYQVLQRFTLVLIYFHFAGKEKQGSQSNGLSKSNWLTPVPECQWDFLECDEGGEPDVVTSVLLSGKRMTGSIPTEISKLSRLTNLQLASNVMTGEIPREMWTMTQLETLTLNVNALEGTISSGLAQLLELRYLSLGSRSFYGTFPDITLLTNLETLIISDSLDVTGPLPDISGLTNLGELVFISNAMTGTMPTHIGLLSKLTALTIANTQLTGTLPTEVGNLVKLELIDFRTARFSGTLPTELGNLSNLTLFAMSAAAFLTGTIPSELGLLSMLETLDFFKAFGLKGSMPAEICALRGQSLVSLRVGCAKVACALGCCTSCAA